MAQIIELTNRSGLDFLLGFVDRARDMRPVLAEIGHDMTESTTQRFSTTTAPDGSAWAPNSELTMARYSANFARKKNGEFTKANAAKIAGKKPLTNEGTLGSTISYQLGDGTVSISSSLPYAATQQFGAKSGEYGFGIYATRNGSFPIPWGDIPARPFLGASESDKANIVKLIRAHMMGG